MLMQSQSVQEFLSGEFSRRMRTNPRYSLRAFARHLNLSPGELSEILRSKRPLSHKSALKVAESLGLNALETSQLLNLVSPGVHAAQPYQAITLSMDYFHTISDWYCFAIVNLMECPDSLWEAQWIARRLSITKMEAQTAMDRLLRLELVAPDEMGRYKPAKDFVASPDQIPSEAIRSFHRQIMNKALQALDNQNVAERDFQGVSFACDPKHLPELKKEISAFADHIARRFSKAKKSEVYHLELALFRLSTGGLDV